MQENSGTHDINERFHAFHDVSKRHRHSSQGNHSGDVTDDMGDGNRKQCVDCITVQDWGFTEAQSPDGHNPQRSDSQLDPRHKPRDREPGKGLLVRNVINDVESVPEEDVEPDDGCGSLLSF